MSRSLRQKPRRIKLCRRRKPGNKPALRRRKTNPEVTKKRLFYETMEDILPELKVIITDGNTQSVLPLGSFADAEENSGAAGTAGGTSGSSSRAGSNEQK